MTSLPRGPFLPCLTFALVAGAASARGGDSDPAAPLPEAEAASSLARWFVPEDADAKSTGIDEEGYYRSLYRRFTLSVGAAAYAKFNTNFQVDGDASVGANVDGEDLLGLDDSSVVARIDATYAFNRRHSLQLSYYDIDRDGERTIPNDIQVGDVLIPAGEVDTEFATEIIKLTYRYNFVTDPRTVIGASFGIHLMQIDLAVRSISFNVEETFKVAAPLPLVGLHGAYALSEKWKLAAAAEFLQFDLGDYRGLISDVRLTLEHDTFENFGWGIGLNSFRSDAKVEDDDLSTELEYGYQGVMLYLRLMF